MTEPRTVHATCIAFGDIAILLRGPAGSGKSDLALRLIEAGAVLVADDRVALTVQEERLFAAAPPLLAGVLEVRGLGLVSLPHVSGVQVVLAADLVAAETVQRLPEPAWDAYLGVRIRTVAVSPFEQTAVAKLRIAAYDAVAQPDPVTGARYHVEEDPTR